MNSRENIKKTVDRAYNLTLDDFDWKPYYPNNMVGNGLEGYYCIFRDVDSTPLRKFTIIFQFQEDEDFIIRDRNLIDSYILFSANLPEDFKGYPEPLTRDQYSNLDDSCYEVNDHGDFLHACKTLDEAKKRVLYQCKMIYGYCMSHLL